MARRFSETTRGVPPEEAMRSTDFRGHGPVVLFEIMRNGFGGTFTNLPAIQIHARHAGLRSERDEFRFMGGEVAPAQFIFFLGQHND
jgi:hypothetical protein